MLTLLRTIIGSLMMITISLINIDLRLGGRYLIIVSAIIGALLAQLFRKIIHERISNRQQALLTGLSLVVTILINKMLFPGLNITIMGILLLYIGMVLMEMVLPNKITFRLKQNYGRN